MDMQDSEIETMVAQTWRPDVLIMLAAFTQFSPPLEEHLKYIRLNYEIPIVLNKVCKQIGAKMMYASTDMVFDGDNPPYAPDSPRNPRSIYGKSKADAETELLAQGNCIIVRLPMMYGLGGSFFQVAFEALTAKNTIKMFFDEFRTCAFVKDVSKMMVDLIRLNAPDNEVWNLGGPQRVSRYELGLALGKALNIPVETIQDLVKPVTVQEVMQSHDRPKDLSLDSSRTFDFLNFVPSDIVSGAKLAISEENESNLKA